MIGFAENGTARYARWRRFELKCLSRWSSGNGSLRYATTVVVTFSSPPLSHGDFIRGEHLPPHSVLRVALVVADVFQELVIRLQSEVEHHGPGFRVGLGIINGDLDVEIADVR